MRKLVYFWGCVMLASLLLVQARGAGEPSTPSGPDVPLKQTGPTTFEMGKVRFDKARKTVSFPAVMNMTNGLVEYLVVTETGKIHESLVRTEAQPYHIHLAMLLLGAKGAGTNAFPEDPAKPLPGEKVSISITWKAGGKETKAPAEDFIMNRQTRVKASRGPWVYNGSQVYRGTFLAQQDGSIVSLMTDAGALLNNPRQGHENDEIWEVISTGLPAIDSPVEVTIDLLPNQKP